MSDIRDAVIDAIKSVPTHAIEGRSYTADVADAALQAFSEWLVGQAQTNYDAYSTGGHDVPRALRNLADEVIR